MPGAGFEVVISEFERSKFVCILDCAAIVLCIKPVVINNWWDWQTTAILFKITLNWKPVHRFPFLLLKKRINLHVCQY